MEPKHLFNRAFALLLATTIVMVLTSCGRNPAPEVGIAPGPEPTDAAPPPEPVTAADPAPAAPTPDPSVVAEPIHFDFDQFAIRADARVVLDRKLALLRDHPAIRLRVAGHADERGSDEYNLALGHRRAMAARSYFTDRGLDPTRFETTSFGEERPVDTRSNEAAWSLNRRAEFERITTTARARDSSP